jgi:hypothetical protein
LRGGGLLQGEGGEGEGDGGGDQAALHEDTYLVCTSDLRLMLQG